MEEPHLHSSRNMASAVVVQSIIFRREKIKELEEQAALRVQTVMPKMDLALKYVDMLIWTQRTTLQAN